MSAGNKVVGLEDETQALPAPDQETLWERWREFMLGFLAVLLFLSLWEWISRSGLVNPVFVSSPSGIMKAFIDMWTNGTLGKDVGVSSYEFVIGYGLAIGVGVPLGICIGWYRVVHALLNPFVTGLYTTPRIALMPLLVLWLGIGLWSKVAIIFLGAVFPLIVNMETAMSALDANLLKAARSFGASEWNIFKTVAIPGSVPYLISGLRLGLGYALIGIVVGEMFAGDAGIGYRIIVSGEYFQTGAMFADVFLLVIAGITLTSLFLVVERRFDAWRVDRP